MNCGTCGNPLPDGAQACPYCGAPVQQSGYAPYTSYPPGYQQPYAYGQQPTRERRGFFTALTELPRAFLDSFTHPGEVLRSLVEKGDLISAPVVAALTLLCAFLAGMVLMRGFVGVLFGAVSRLTGVSMAGTTASMNQGISYIVGRVGPTVGGIAALCQAISMLVPTVVFMIYVCAVCHVTFSWELALGFLAVASLSTPVAAVMAMALSLLSPWLALLPMICASALSYAQACNMLWLITGRDEARLFGARAACVTGSIALTLLLCGLTGGWLMNGVMNRVLLLLGSVGSLI